MPTLSFIITIVLCYLLGSIPFGLVVTKLAGLGDIRLIGSGNIGATNVLRTGRKSLAVLTVLLDGGKGTAAVLAVKFIIPALVSYAAIAVLLGHLFPFWLKFKGGKGVATTMGILLALAWPIGLVTIGFWVGVAAVTRYSSLAALISIGLSPLFCFWFDYSHLIPVTVVIAALVFVKHKDNIKRLRAGTEPQIGRKL